MTATTARATDAPAPATSKATAKAAAPTTAPPDARVTARRVEELLDRLAAGADPASAQVAEDMVRVLMDFYGAGLARITTLLGPALDGLLGDELVAALLALHGLHPHDAERRITDTLRRIAPEHPAELLSFDQESGTVRLRLPERTGCGCGSAAADQEAIEDALTSAAPEVGSVEFQAPDRAPTFLQIGSRPDAPLSVEPR
ncbi:hypothetical protein [Streptacidiphilus sp. EB129]|uniref:hypothetical protein n=1 Tax=Streptacidiphilus sp. EB129 TaxID=3156262 RepID=UPI003517B890